MSEERWTVVKVGGSLYDLPDLRERLCRWLARIESQRVLLIPGGGLAANAVRKLDRAHNLGEEASHWLAIQALSLNAGFLGVLLPGYMLSAEPTGASGRVILDALRFFQADEQCPHHLPHRWEVTSDSLAVRAAALVGARELILLKSVAWDGGDWVDAVGAGVVDPYFERALAGAPAELQVRVVNLRMQ